VASVAAAAVARLGLFGLAGTQAPLATFYPAVMVAGMYGGLGPGIFSIVLSAIAAAFLMDPTAMPDLADRNAVARLSIFLMVSGLTLWLCQMLMSARARAEGAARELGESEDRYRSIVELSPDAVFVNAGGVIAYANAATLKLFGATDPRQILGRSPLELAHPDFHPAIKERVRQLLSGKPVPPLEEKWARLDGSPLTVEAVAAPLTWKGEPAIQVILRDVSARKQAEEARTLSEARFSRLFEQSPLATQMVSREGRITRTNAGWEKLWGVRLDQLGDYNMLQDQQLVERGIMPLIERAFAGEPVSLPPNPYVPDRGPYAGKQRWVRGVIYPVKDAQDRVEEIVIIQEDITEQRRTHEQLEASEARLRRSESRLLRLQRVTEALSQSLTMEQVAEVVVGQGMEVLGASAGSLALATGDGTELQIIRSTGYAEDAIRPWLRFPLDAPVPLSDAVRRVQAVFLETPEERLARYPALAAVKANKDTRASACLPLVVGAKAIGVLGLSFSGSSYFTPQDREFMLSFARQCAQAVERARLFEGERTARAEAERASRAKDEFIAVLSHELRTPLTPVLLTVSLMESHPALPPELREDVATIRRNVELESRLISDLLDLTRIVRGKLQFDVQTVDVHLLLRAAIDICQREDSVRLVLEAAATRVHAHGDATRLQQVFWNLINNAQKFTPKDGVITVRTSDAPGGRIRVQVSDTGAGIDAAILPRLFNAFEQGEVRATRQFAGLGLGLAISKRLVEAHGGSIAASSEGRGRGATFTVELPAAEAQVGDEAKPAAGAAQLPNGTPLRILLVEDHDETLQVMSRLLKGMGHHVVTAGSLASATAASRSQPFDLVLSDIGLPDGSGLDLMRELGGRYAGRSIALTGYGMEEDVRNSIEAGFAAHLTKPVDFEQLRSAIGRVLEGNRNDSRVG
jgi:PAS domain S-box-containing protein